MPRKKVFEEEPEEEVYEWDKLRIILFFVVIILLIVAGFVGKRYFLDAKSPSASVPITKAQESVSHLPTAEDIKQQLVTLQDQASQISVQDIASSSPQVKQILQQLKDLPNVPGNTLKQTCTQICNNL